MKHLLLVFVFCQSLLAQNPFSTDSAFSFLKVISKDIGPRPMGSPNERKALEYGMNKFHEFGLHEVYFMTLTVAESEMTHQSMNTNTGVAVGVLRGSTGRMIVIGGHMDSAGPDIPGANDDGSGAASVIELARVLSKEQHQSTLVFCLFGGEEAGLIGSKYFAQTFTSMDSVALMLELDMTNGSDLLIPTLDCKSGNSPRWLVKAAYEEFDHLGYSGLEYTTHFFTSMLAVPGGGVGSDHEPFLEKNIPAIDFTSDMTDPIHTPQDDLEHFKPGGLKRSGDLVYALVRRFDAGVPKEKTDRYYLTQIGRWPFFVPIWLLWGITVLSLVFAMVVLRRVRIRRTEAEKSTRPKIPALKLFLAAIIIQLCVWLSSLLVGAIKGVSYPWMASPDNYFVLAFLAGLLGIALSLLLTPRLHLSKDPYRWLLRSVVFLFIFTVLLIFVNIKLAMYPALGLFFVSCAMIVRMPWLKFTLWLLAPHFMFRLFFPDGFLFFGRLAALQMPGNGWMSATLHAVFILFFAFWSFPFLLAFAAVYHDSGVDLLWLKQVRTTRGISVLALCCIVYIALLIPQPSYSDPWRQDIFLTQTVDVDSCKGTMKLTSGEYLHGLQVHLADKDTTIASRNRDIMLKNFSFGQIPWMKVERIKTTSADSNTTFDMMVTLHFKYRPQSFSLTYSGGKKKLRYASSLYALNTTEQTVSLRWQSFPDTLLQIPIHFQVIKGDSLTETIEAKFLEMAEPVRIEKELANIIPRTTMKRTEILSK